MKRATKRFKEKEFLDDKVNIKSEKEGAKEKEAIKPIRRLIKS